MSDFYIYEGPDLDELIEKSLLKLGLNENDVEMEILKEGSEGFLGFGKKNYKIKIIPLVSVTSKKEKTENIEDVLENIEKKNTDKVVLSIDKSKDGIFLVSHSEKKGELDDVQKVIEENGIVNVDYEAVKEFLESDKPQVKIAEYDPDIYVDSEITIEISDDNMQAFITATEPQGGSAPTVKGILELIAKENIVFGIIEHAPNEIVKDLKYNEKILIAKGIEPQKGKNGRLEFKINLAKNIKPQLLEDGSVDFKHLDIITNVVKGEVLAEYKMPEKGKNGKDILGNVIESEVGEDISIEGFVGKNVELSEDGQKITSLLDGQVMKEGEKLTVTPVYIIEGDVDLKVGNIDFIGSVIIKGSVLDGFYVKAKGNIEIEKTVGACDLEA
ncbi:MAG: FapA family protein, partial [Candidatus Muirbacterium halophilum]|nr:FapA family protein [Candidatus Muirbacterium halophilum]